MSDRPNQLDPRTRFRQRVWQLALANVAGSVFWGNCYVIWIKRHLLPDQ